MKLHRVGIAVASVEKALPAFEALLDQPANIVETVPEENVRVAIFRLGANNLELIEPTAPESAIAKSLARRGQ